MFDNGVDRVGSQPELGPVQARGSVRVKVRHRVCLHWRDDEGVERELVQGLIVTGSIEQVLTELLGNGVAEHGVP